MSKHTPKPPRSSLFPDHMRVDRATVLLAEARSITFEDAWKIIRKELHTGSIAGSASIGFDLHPVPSREWLSMLNGIDAVKVGLFTFQVEHVLSRQFGEGNLLRMARDPDEFSRGTMRSSMQLRAYIRDDDLATLLCGWQLPGQEADTSAASMKAPRGRKPALRKIVKAKMRDALNEGNDVFGMKQEALPELFGASRTTCVEALKELVSEMPENVGRQKTANDK